MTGSVSPAATLKLLGGRLCLDFANTADWHKTAHPEERLHTYRDLVHWARHAGAIPHDAVGPLLAEAARRPQEAAAALESAITLREAIYRIFVAVAEGAAAARADLATLNAALATALAHARLEATSGGYAWGWAASASLDRPLWPVARSAAELLTSPELGRVRQCADAGCGWLFLDGSRNRSRRWCDMRDCGNRAKARRHYQRWRAGQEP